LRKSEELVARENKVREEYKSEDVEDVYRRYGTL